MARRRPVEPAAGGELLLPWHLADSQDLGPGEDLGFCRERRAWFKAHGIDPGNWSEVKAIVNASRAAHGFPDTTALSRDRLRIEGRS